MTSEPFLPKLVGNKDFDAPIFHPIDLPLYTTTFNPSETICVFGGTKSAFDVVYTYASKGHKVDGSSGNQVMDRPGWPLHTSPL